MQEGLHANGNCARGHRGGCSLAGSLHIANMRVGAMSGGMYRMAAEKRWASERERCHKINLCARPEWWEMGSEGGGLY